jgi:glucose-fructose oxidoreductase
VSEFRTPPSRRLFLRDLALGGAALTAFGCASRTTPAHDATEPSRAGQADAKQDRKLGVALLGLGAYSAEQLAPALEKTQHCALRAIVTGSPDKVPEWQRKYEIPDGNVYSYESLPSIANNSAVDVVYVVVPTALHAKYAIMAANAGKHVWCEKPMAMNVEECQSIIDACRKNGVTLSVGYRMQHEPNTQTVMEYARTKPYGPIKNVRAVAGDRSGGEPTWRMVKSMGGGALYDMGVYAINAIRYATGEEPVRVVRARQWAERPELFREVDEITEFELELPSGALGFGRASRAGSENMLRIECERGWYQLEPMQAYDGVKGKTSDDKALDRVVDDQQRQQMDDDALAILERRPLPVPGEEGLRDIRIVQAIMESARTGAPVSLT